MKATPLHLCDILAPQARRFSWPLKDTLSQSGEMGHFFAMGLLSPKDEAEIEWDSTPALPETPGGPGGHVVGPSPQALALDRAASKTPS